MLLRLHIKFALLLSIIFFHLAPNDSLVQDIEFTSTYEACVLMDAHVQFLWRDSSANIVINQDFCQTISDPEKAALAYVATFIGNDCWWDGDYSINRDNLKCAILSALDLGYQCSEKHLGFLRHWFRQDENSLKELESCPTIPYTSTIQDMFDEIILTTKGNEIVVSYKASGINVREDVTWEWTEKVYFQLEEDHIKLIKKESTQ